MELDFPTRLLRNGLEDRISHLPNEILCRILSLMPTRYSIRTSVLSKRWGQLWILAPKLYFKPDWDDIKGHKNDIDWFSNEVMESCVPNFTRSVDNLLFLRGNLCIESFRLYHPYCKGKIDRLRLNSWICSVLTCNVRELELEVFGEINFFGGLPWMLFTCKTLVVLKITGFFVIDVPYNVCLPNLKTLVLDDVIFLDDVSIPKLLSGCPVLEDLELGRDSWGILSIYDISHPKLKRLTLELNDLENDQEGLMCDIKIDAPNLEYIWLHHSWMGDFVVNSLPSNTEVDINIYRESYGRSKDIEYGKKVLAFLKGIKNVKCLSVCFDITKHCVHGIEPNLPKFCNLVQLKMEADVENFPKLLMSFLESSPKLEVLSLPLGIQSEKAESNDYDNDDDDDDDDVYYEYGWFKPQSVPECLLHSLKSIQIRSFWGRDEELKVVKYLLENAMILTNMTISCPRSPTSEGQMTLFDQHTWNNFCNILTKHALKCFGTCFYI